ncbi:MAG: hypothetical protein HYZ48_04010, partial [Chlamydiales bacterium]|nr:hypothetical protein [Chlamydiales bacterium]
LLQRGINRIAKSLYGQHPSLIWYISRRLDIEKGTMLLNLCSALDHPQGAHLLIEQVVELAQSIHNYTPV